MRNRSEAEFARLVDSLAADPHRRGELADLLREDHSWYEQRGTATIVRMRGWVLIALARTGVTDGTLLFILEELDNGVDAYLIAAAATALRAYPSPKAAFGPFLVNALQQIRYRDEPVSFEAYGAYAMSGENTTAVRELVKTVAWLGPHARSVLPDLEALRSQSAGLSKELATALDQTLKAIKNNEVNEYGPAACCDLPSNLANKMSWLRNYRRSSRPIESAIFEDQDGTRFSFKEFFRGHPSIVVFFYTRCDNPLKCSLTVTKLGRIQKLIEQHGLDDRVNTAAITYDPDFDLPKRLRAYGRDRNVRMDARNRMLRATAGIDALARHFKLGINFIESLVNRHRIEAYVLDDEGRVAASFARLRWNEQEVIDRAVELLRERDEEASSIDGSKHRAKGPNKKLALLGSIASVAVAFFPKCPICWAAYLSMFGIAGFNQIPYSPWLQPIFALVMAINLLSVWLRGWSTKRIIAPLIATTGALIILASRTVSGWEKLAVCGVLLTLAGSLLSAVTWRPRKSLAFFAKKSLMTG